MILLYCGTERNKGTMLHTSPDQLKAFLDRVSLIRQPEDLFGDLGLREVEQLQRLETCYRSLLKSYHPDHFVSRPAEQHSATEITKLLNALRERAVIKIKRNIYGEERQLELREYTSVIHTARHEY